MTHRLVLLAFDGLDWSLGQSMVDAGQMPCFAQLLGAGASGAISVPPPLCATSVWATMATGVMADRHGVCHDLEPRADGLTLAAIGTEALQAPSLWQQVEDAGLTAYVAGWPVCSPRQVSDEARLLSKPRGCRVGAGFDIARNATVACWPLPPGLVWPTSHRCDVIDSLVHPSEVTDAAVHELLQASVERPEQGLQDAARELVARWSSMQALGLRWAVRTDWSLLALRFDGLPEWMQNLHPRVTSNLPTALAATYRWVDLIVGRYMHILGRSVHLIVVSHGGLPNGGYKGRASIYDNTASGGLIVAGPGVQPDSLLGDGSALDVCPTALGLLGLPCAIECDGRDLLAASTPIRSVRAAVATHSQPAGPRWVFDSQDGVALDWLHRNHLPAIDTAPMRAMVHSVQIETRVAWASARRAREQFDEAIAEWTAVLSEVPAHLPARLALGEALIAAGRAPECAALLDEVPTHSLRPPWKETFTAIIAHAAQDWPMAERYLGQLVEQGSAPINAPAWLGWARIMQGDWLGAKQWFLAARRWPGEAARVYEGFGIALFNLAEHSQAIVAFSRAIAHQPSAARLHAMRATALAASGAFEAAQTGWWRALELDPSLPNAVERLARSCRMPLAHVEMSNVKARATLNQPLQNSRT